MSRESDAERRWLEGLDDEEPDEEEVRRGPVRRLMPGPRGDDRGREVQGRDLHDREGPR